MKRAHGFVVAAIVLATVGCGDDGNVEGVVGTTLEERVLHVGEVDVDVTLREGADHPTRLLVPAAAVPRRTDVTVRLTSVMKTGAVVPTGTAVHIATKDIAFAPAAPARMQQAVAPPPPGKRYVAVQAQGASDPWVPRRAGRRVPQAITVGASRMPLVPAPGTEVWEIDVAGTGLWAIALVDDAVAPDGGVAVSDGGVVAPDAGVVDAQADGGSADAQPRVSLDPAPTRNEPGLYLTPGAPTIAAPQSFEIRGTGTSQPFSGNVTDAVGDGAFYLVKTEDVDGGAATGQTELAFAIPAMDGRYNFTAPLFCGVQLAKIVWRNAVGTSVLVLRVTTANCVEPDVRATIAWDDQGRDWELHLVKPGGTINDNATDCTWTSCVGAHPDWGVPNDPSDDPAKDVDNTGAYGPENIFLVRPETGRFTVLVEHWGSGQASSGQAILNVRGVATVVPITGFVTHHVRTIATIDWPSGVVNVVGSDFDCTANWSGGCKAKLPAN